MIVWQRCVAWVLFRMAERQSGLADAVSLWLCGGDQRRCFEFWCRHRWLSGVVGVWGHLAWRLAPRAFEDR